MFKKEFIKKIQNIRDSKTIETVLIKAEALDIIDFDLGDVLFETYPISFLVKRGILPKMGLPKQIAYLNKLQHLDLSSIPSTQIPDSIYNLKNIETLNLSNTKLCKLSPKISKLSNLKHLYLENNNLQNFPYTINFLKKLKSIHASGNKFNTLPNRLSGLKSLETLHLDNNKIGKLYIPVLKNLEYLNLSNNEITHIVPVSFENAPSIKNLNFTNNKFEKIPKEILLLQKLEILIFAHNKLQKDYVYQKLRSANTDNKLKFFI